MAVFFLYCLLISFLFLTFAAVMKAIIFGIILTAIGLGLVNRNNGKWYEYVAAAIIGIILTLGFLISE